MYLPDLPDLPDLPNRCQESIYIKDSNDNTGKLKCTLCEPGYYLNSKGECINYLNYIKPIPNCSRYSYKINNITFCLDTYYYSYTNPPSYYNYSYYCVYKYYNNSNNDYYHHYYNYYSNIYDYYGYINNYYYSKYKIRKNNISLNITIPEINSEINAECIECETGYYKNDFGDCVLLKDEDCSLISIIENFPERYQDCRRICSYNDYLYLFLFYYICFLPLHHYNL
jgi:hypothetical protein